MHREYARAMTVTRMFAPSDPMLWVLFDGHDTYTINEWLRLEEELFANWSSRVSCGYAHLNHKLFVMDIEHMVESSSLNVTLLEVHPGSIVYISGGMSLSSDHQISPDLVCGGGDGGPVAGHTVQVLPGECGFGAHTARNLLAYEVPALMDDHIQALFFDNTPTRGCPQCPDVDPHQFEITLQSLCGSPNPAIRRKARQYMDQRVDPHAEVPPAEDDGKQEEAQEGDAEVPADEVAAPEDIGGRTFMAGSIQQVKQQWSFQDQLEQDQFLTRRQARTVFERDAYAMMTQESTWDGTYDKDAHGVVHAPGFQHEKLAAQRAKLAMKRAKLMTAHHYEHFGADPE